MLGGQSDTCRLAPPVPVPDRRTAPPVTYGQPHFNPERIANPGMWKKNVASGTYDTPISISMAEAHMRLRDAFQEAVAKEAATLARQIIDTHREELVALIEHDFTDLLKAAVTEVIVARIFPGK